MVIGDTNEYGQTVASIENLYAVERFGITEYGELDIDGPKEWEDTKSFAEAGRIWRRWSKEPTCGIAVLYRVRYYKNIHGEIIEAEELAVKNGGPRDQWVEHGSPMSIVVREQKYG